MPFLAQRSFATRAVHAGERAARPDFTPVVTPIQPTVGYLYDSMDDLDAVFGNQRPGFVYPRYGSPTVAAFEAAMADLEGGEAAHAFASGMAAIHVSLLAAGVRAGTTVVASPDLYGATYSILQRLFHELGVHVRFVNTAEPELVDQVLAATDARALMVETISNPLLKVADLSCLAEVAHRHGACLLVDNTFASPYLCNPLRHRADFVIHSATKFIAGHGDTMAGAVVTSAERRQQLYELNKLVGSVLGPFEAWLALRGLKTLPLRMRQQCANAQAIAEWLTAHPSVTHVYYPGLPARPDFVVASHLFAGRGYGGVLSFEIADADRARVFRFMERLRLCLPATTLGDVYTLVLHPATSSHRSLSAEERERLGIREGLVRLSAGIEEVEDIIADLDQALSAVR